MEKMLLTAGEAGEVLGISKWKVYDLFRRSELDWVKIGGLRRVPRVALERYIERLSTVDDVA